MSEPTRNSMAVLDYEHLDNGLFLTAFARELSRRPSGSTLILHGDSAYTDRLTRSGTAVQDAKLRSIRDLNHRLVALLADYGVAAVGIHGYQQSMVRLENGTLKINMERFLRIPSRSTLVLSNLADGAGDQPVPIPLAQLAEALSSGLNLQEVLIFRPGNPRKSTSEERPSELNRNELSREEKERWLPKEFRSSGTEFTIIEPEDLSGCPVLGGTSLI
ncbi:MAG: hypothetical protein WDZ29_00810 [Balneolaceae bacterium]